MPPLLLPALSCSRAHQLRIQGSRKTFSSSSLYFESIKFENRSFHIQAWSFICGINFSFWLPPLSYNPTLIPLLKFFPILYEISCLWVLRKIFMTFTTNRPFRKWNLCFFLKAWFLLIHIFHFYLMDIQSCSPWIHSVPRTCQQAPNPLFCVLLWI